MKKLIKPIVLMLMTIPASTSFAGQASGCGVGTILFEGKSGYMANILAATSNTSTGNTFAVSSGTLGCDKDAVVDNQFQRKLFVANNLDSLSNEIAQGQGDHLTSLASLMGIEKKDQTEFYSVTQNQYSVLFKKGNINADQVLATLDKILLNNPILSRYVKA